MSLKHYTCSLEIRAVDTTERVIEGYANVFGVVDAYGTRWTAQTFERTLREDASSIIALEGHDLSRLPVGKPIEMRIDDHGLFTRTLIAPGAHGNEVLDKARFWQDQGQPIGMSVGFQKRKSHFEGNVEVFDDVTLREFSFVPGPMAAVPGSMVTAVRAEGEAPDPHEVIDSAIEALMLVRDESAERVNASRTLGLDVRTYALTEDHAAMLQTTLARLHALLDPAIEKPVPPDPDPDEGRRAVDEALKALDMSRVKGLRHA